jgi:hypothetical protein
MSNHTAGPWKVFDSDVSGLSVNAANECKRICDVARNARDDDRANAALIASAPELLSALKRAYKQCIEFLNEGDFRRNVEWDAGYIVDAINKAEGRKGAL